MGTPSTSNSSSAIVAVLDSGEWPTCTTSFPMRLLISVDLPVPVSPTTRTRKTGHSPLIFRRNSLRSAISCVTSNVGNLSLTIDAIPMQ